MTRRLASVAGTVTTVTAGVLMAWVGMSALGPIPTLILFGTVAALASLAGLTLRATNAAPHRRRK